MGYNGESAMRTNEMSSELTRLEIRPVRDEAELQAAKALRVSVFVGEQGVPASEEFDDQDEHAFHAVALLGGNVVGTGRLYKATHTQARVGRMAVQRSLRRQGIGSAILAFLEDEAKLQGAAEVVLHAQTYVRPFYERSGYRAEGKGFDEVGIKHVRMVKRLR